ncbi:hypothetical protein F2Q70_00008463 [Brassica cretica]|uniref:C2H2-type domain-containing protein n=1 Tax=Brassica cretica TaxID=69181 RepID=A0A8S9M6U3_BRACR|nr:hypothetical protein F2Q68_00001482 [Brassica cretica]KAF2615824.1 hypothetical protein F2Q70_00008463 [Brassica cretica]
MAAGRLLLGLCMIQKPILPLVQPRECRTSEHECFDGSCHEEWNPFLIIQLVMQSRRKVFKMSFKGLLIPASKTELPSLVQCAAPSISQDHSSDHSTSSSLSVTVVPSDAQPLVSVKKGPSTAPEVAPVGTAKSEPETLIGLKFRADKIRELHPAVISSLFDDLPHLCNSCGVRLKQKEDLDRHMELHDKKLELFDQEFFAELEVRKAIKQVRNYLSNLHTKAKKPILEEVVESQREQVREFS